MAREEATQSDGLRKFLWDRKVHLDKMIPRGALAVEKLLGSAILAAKKVAALARCSPESVFLCVMDAAALGLTVHWGPRGEAALVPYGEKCQLIIGYRGYGKLLRREGGAQSVIMKAVRFTDQFDYYVDDKGEHLLWRPDFRTGVVASDSEDAEPADLAATMLCFAQALYPTGARVELRERFKFDKVREHVFSGIKDDPKDWRNGKTKAEKEALSPYTKWPVEMWMKGCVIGLAKLDMNDMVELALETDRKHEKDMGEAERVDMAKVRALEIPAQTRVHEVITAPEREPEKVTVERAVDRPPGQRIVDESESAQPTRATGTEPTKVKWTDENEAHLSEWETTDEPVPVDVARELTDAARTVVGEARKALAARILKLQARVKKERQPGEEG